MWSPLTPALRDEIRTFRLVFTCEACAHFVKPSSDPAASTDGACDLLYPTEPHREATFAAKVDGEPVLFCKMFEAD